MKRVWLEARVAGCILFLLMSLPAFAQFSASLQGTAQDSSGAVVPNATITLINQDTKVTRRATADSSGVFRIEALPPGNYLIRGTAQGFGTVETPFVLQAAENRNVNLTLKVGTTTTSVEVTEKAPLLDTSDSRNQATIDTQQIESLPLDARNALNTMQLTPGVTGLGVATFGAIGTGTFWSNVPQLSANGRGENGNQYVLDDLDLDQSVNPAGILIVPNADAIQEISVQTNTYTVDFGDTSSIQTILTSKSGTSQYHGFGSAYYTWQGITARGEFGPPSSVPVNPFHTTNLSFGLGGPVIPKHQFFFFGSVEPYRALTANGNSVQTYEDPAFVSFAQTAQPNSPEVELMTKYPPSGATTTGVSATALQAFGPQNTASNTGCETPSTDNIPCSTPVFDHGFFNSSSYNHSLAWNVRLDKYFSKDRLYGTAFRSTVNTGGPSVRPAFATTNYDSNFSISVNETHDFTSQTLNQAVFGYVFIQGTSSATGLFTVPEVSVNGLGVGFGDGFADGNFAENNYHWRDVLTHIHGAHSFKFGYEGAYLTDVANFAPCYGIPSFSFTNMINLINNEPYSESSLSYNPVTGKPMPGNYYFATVTGGGFAEDTWKANRKLTVNYGIRYDNFGNPFPTGNTILANFHLGSGSTMAEQVASGRMTQQSRVFNSDRNWNFSPRAGIAWDPTGEGKWVIRGGFGVYRDWVTLGNAENNLKANPPSFVVPTFFSNGSTAAPIFGYGTSNTYPFGFPYPAFVGMPLDSAGGIAGSQISVGGVDVSIKTPHTFNWSGTVERQITTQLVASVGYVGQHSGNLQVSGGNPGANAFATDVNVFSGDLLQHLTCTPVSPPDGLEANCSGVQTRLNPSFGSIAYTYNGPWSNYAAFIAAIKGEFSRRAFVTASYTLSKSQDNSSQGPGGNGYPVENPLSRWYGPSQWDARNRASIGFNYELPGSTRNGFLRRITGGWNLSSIIILQSGYPFMVYTSAPLDVYKDPTGTIQYRPDSGDFNADGDNNDFPNATGYNISRTRASYKSGVFTHCSGTNLDDCGLFTFPAVGMQGNEKVNQFRDPGFSEVEGTIKKVTPITERVNLELRVDFFNLFNRVNLTGVDPNAADGTNFGTSTSTYAPRNGQLGVKLSF